MTKNDDDMPGTLIFVVSETLTDNSKVYNVVLGEHKWHATDQTAAVALAEAIMDAINDFTVDTADVVDETAWAED